MSRQDYPWGGDQEYQERVKEYLNQLEAIQAAGHMGIKVALVAVLAGILVLCCDGKKSHVSDAPSPASVAHQTHSR